MKGDGLSTCSPLYLSILVVLVSIQFAASAVNGSSAAKPVDPNTLKCKVYNLTLKITNASYEDTLATPGTPQYNKLRVEVEVGVMQAYDGNKPFIGVSTSSFSKAQDGKVLVQFLIEFSGNATEHLKTLTAAIAAGKLGRLAVDKKLKKADCYKAPPPPICPMPCSSLCAPTCMPTCCQQYQPAPVYVPPPPMPLPPPPPPQPQMLPPPQPTTCGPRCPNTACAPSCSSSCCNTVYRPQYGKRHHAPHPKEGTKKTHISHLHKLHKGH